MKTRTSSHRSGRVERGAFTLVELMVVITIMAALAALTASAVLKFIAVQQTSNTQSTLDRVQSQLNRAWSKVKDEAYYKEPIPLAVENWMKSFPSTANPIAGSDANANDRMRVLYVKLRMRQQFPMSFNEALNPAPLLPLPAYQMYLNSMGITGSSPQTASIESSACLLMALQRGVSGAGIDPSQLTTGGAAGIFGKLPYLTDAWGRPIFFTRAPAGNLYLNPITNPTTRASNVANIYSMSQLGTVTCYSQPGNNDPGDPQGLLVSTPWRSAVGGRFSALTSEVVPLLPQGANTSFKLAPMVASGGPSDWTKPGQILPFDPITFYTTPGSDALFSTP
jgi:prepilin-type N-terminal cleavage/methylation domain-containing protein